VTVFIGSAVGVILELGLCRIMCLLPVSKDKLLLLWEPGTPVTAVRVVRIHLIDGDEANQHVYRQERWDKSASTRCAPQSTPLRLPLRHNRPLPAPSRLLPPLTSPSRALGALAKMTSVTEITALLAVWNPHPEPWRLRIEDRA
jgi:hypothetical protein